MEVALIISAFGGMIVGSFFTKIIVGKITRKYYELMIDSKRVGLMYYQWLHLFLDGIDICEGIIGKGYRRIAVYGMGTTGELLSRAVHLNKGLELVVIVDRAADMIAPKYNNYNMQTDLRNDSDVDCVIITEPKYFDEMKSNIEKYSSADVLSIEDLLFPSGIEYDS